MQEGIKYTMALAVLQSHLSPCEQPELCVEADAKLSILYGKVGPSVVPHCKTIDNDNVCVIIGDEAVHFCMDMLGF